MLALFAFIFALFSALTQLGVGRSCLPNTVGLLAHKVQACRVNRRPQGTITQACTLEVRVKLV